MSSDEIANLLIALSVYGGSCYFGGAFFGLGFGNIFGLFLGFLFIQILGALRGN